MGWTLSKTNKSITLERGPLDVEPPFPEGQSHFWEVWALWGGEKSEGVSLLKGTTVAAVKQNIGMVVVRGHAHCFILLKWLTGMWLWLKPKISRSC